MEHCPTSCSHLLTRKTHDCHANMANFIIHPEVSSGREFGEQLHVEQSVEGYQGKNISDHTKLRTSIDCVITP